jgi:FKBP-type peptidyl-prolyl cis-trans isomerase FklB
MIIKAALAAGILVFSIDSFAADPKPLATQQEKASYGIGMNVGSRFKHDLIELDIDAFIRGFRDSLAGNKPAVNEKEIEAAIAAVSKDIESKMAAQGEKNKKTGDAFLAENTKAKGVITTESGLQYQVISEGSGPTPKAEDVVKVHYKGTLIDGTVFDSSYERGEPATFPVGRVIKGWVEAIQKMKVGSKWKLFIPADLAYGEMAQGKIPPQSTLIFEVELLGIEK